MTDSDEVKLLPYNELRLQLADWLNAFKADPFPTGIAKVDRLLEIVRPPVVTDEVVELRGTMECPYCGVATPHHHKPDEIKGMVPGLVPRLTKLAEELATRSVGFYSSMHRAYGTEYGQEAEAKLLVDLRQVIAKLDALTAMPAVVSGGQT